MINNFSKFESFLKFSSDDEFYFLQIMKRRKDNPNMEKGVKILDEIYIDNFEFYQRKQEDWIRTANENNARVTIRVNHRSYRKCAFKSLIDIANKIELGQFSACKHSFKNMAGKYKAKGEKFWIVDIDNTKDPQDIERCMNSKSRLPLKDDDFLKLESKTGFHLITKPFDLRKFTEFYKPPANPNAIKIEIIKDGCTNLYIP